MNRMLLVSAGILGFLGVALGAFGAHILEKELSVKMIEAYRTGIVYHLIHSTALLAVALFNNSRFTRAGYFFIAGIILFSFTLYTYAITGLTFFAMITPIGGISFLIGWGILIYSGLKA